MVVVVFSALLGLFGSFLKPLPFVAALVPIVAAASVALAVAIGLSWLTALAAFYGILAVAEVAYIGAVTVRHQARLFAHA